MVLWPLLGVSTSSSRIAISEAAPRPHHGQIFTNLTIGTLVMLMYRGRHHRWSYIAANIYMPNYSEGHPRPQSTLYTLISSAIGS